MVKQLNKEDIGESDIVAAINSFDLGRETEEFAKTVGGKLVYNLESLYEAAEWAVANNKLDPAEAKKIIEEGTEEYNKAFINLLLKPTETISEEIYLKYKDKFTQAGITLTQGVDGWDITTPIEEYLELVEG
jgi:glutamyl-tRNA reductase